MMWWVLIAVDDREIDLETRQKDVYIDFGLPVIGTLGTGLLLLVSRPLRDVALARACIDISCPSEASWSMCRYPMPLRDVAGWSVSRYLMSLTHLQHSSMVLCVPGSC